MTIKRRTSLLKQSKLHSKHFFLLTNSLGDDRVKSFKCYSIFPSVQLLRNPKVDLENFYDLSTKSSPGTILHPDNLELAYFSIELDAQSEFFYIWFSFQFLLSHPPLLTLPAHFLTMNHFNPAREKRVSCISLRHLYFRRRIETINHYRK